MELFFWINSTFCCPYNKIIWLNKQKFDWFDQIFLSLGRKIYAPVANVIFFIVYVKYATNFQKFNWVNEKKSLLQRYRFHFLNFNYIFQTFQKILLHTLCVKINFTNRKRCVKTYFTQTMKKVSFFVSFKFFLQKIMFFLL